MSVTISGNTYYRTKEACQMAGISRSTFLRWLETGIINDASHKDRRGWRLFTEADIERITTEALKFE